MTYFVGCRRCGHLNAPETTVCAGCQHPLDPGIRHAMNCPLCGRANGAGARTCSLCGYNLQLVEKIPRERRTLPCPYCQTANPPPVQPDAAAYCLHCGRQIQIAGAGYSLPRYRAKRS